MQENLSRDACGVGQRKGRVLLQVVGTEYP